MQLTPKLVAYDPQPVAPKALGDWKQDAGTLS